MSVFNPVYLPTKGNVPVERVLDGAKGCESVVIVGKYADGTYHYASSMGDGKEIIWLLEKMKHATLEQAG